MKIVSIWQPFRAGRKGRGPAGATAEPSGGVEAPAFRPGRTSTEEIVFTLKHHWMTVDYEPFELYAIA